MATKSHNFDAVILCGGRGTRLQRILPGLPKVMAPINGRPFLDLLVRNLNRQGFSRFVLCTGYLKDQVKKYVEEKYKNRKDIEFVFSEEERSLGTGGAVRLAAQAVKSRQFLVVNGDTFCEFDFSKLRKFHRDKKALVSMMLFGSLRKDGGGVRTDGEFRITDFAEKERNYPYVNGGVYFMDVSVKKAFPESEVMSLERDFFPKLAQSGNFFGYVNKGKVVDIGTPERLKRAKKFLNKFYEA